MWNFKLCLDCEDDSLLIRRFLHVPIQDYGIVYKACPQFLCRKIQLLNFDLTNHLKFFDIVRRKKNILFLNADYLADRL